MPHGLGGLPKGTMPKHPVKMGRPKGALAATTKLAKDCIAFAAEGMGGGPGMLKWVKADPKNEYAFWTQIYTKLVPVQVGGDPNGVPLIHVIKRLVVDPLNPDS